MSVAIIAPVLWKEHNLISIQGFFIWNDLLKDPVKTPNSFSFSCSKSLFLKPAQHILLLIFYIHLWWLIYQRCSGANTKYKNSKLYLPRWNTSIKLLSIENFILAPQITNPVFLRCWLIRPINSDVVVIYLHKLLFMTHCFIGFLMTGNLLFHLNHQSPLHLQVQFLAPHTN